MQRFRMLAVALIAVGPLVTASAASPVNGHANYRAVCPDAGLAAVHCYALVVTDGNGNPNASTSPSGYGPTQFRTAYELSGTPAGRRRPRSSMRTTIRTPKPTSRRTARSTSCRPARAGLAALRRSARTVAPRRIRITAGRLRSPSMCRSPNAICTYCKILLVEASSNRISDLGVAEAYASTHAGVVVVSNSYGATEFSGETAYDAPYTNSNVAITVSSGDSGYGVSGRRRTRSWSQSAARP